MKFKDFDELVRMVKGKSNRIVSPGANNAEVIEAIKIADGYGLISGGVLIGDTAQIKSLAAEAKLDLKKFELCECLDKAGLSIRDIRKVIAKLPAKRQSLFFSATLQPEVIALARTLVHDPVHVTITPEQLTVEKIAQKVLFVDRQNKDAAHATATQYLVMVVGQPSPFSP